jgi:hypothetical protein
VLFVEKTNCVMLLVSYRAEKLHTILVEEYLHVAFILVEEYLHVAFLKFLMVASAPPLLTDLSGTHHTQSPHHEDIGTSFQGNCQCTRNY